MAFFARLTGGDEPTPGDPAPEEASHAELMYRPGGSEPGPRLEDMDADGIDVAVLYPTTPGLAYVPEADVFHTMAREYNRWLHEFCSEDARAPDRRRPGAAAGPAARGQGDGALRGASSASRP